MAHDGAEHSLEVKSGTDRLANFSQRFVFSDRSRQFACPRLQFFKQPHVLDRDDGLGRKGFKEFNLLSGERTDLLSTDRNSSNRNTLSQQRCDKQCPRAGPLLACLGTTKLSFHLYREIVHMNCLPLNYSTTSWAVSVNRYVFVR